MRRISIIYSSIVLAVMAVPVYAQDISLNPTSTQSVGNQNITVLALTILRLSLGIIILAAGLIALGSGYHWYNHEGNKKKAEANKKRLAATLLVITIVFIALSLFHLFIPDYEFLTL